jgi:hypothetical protein
LENTNDEVPHYVIFFIFMSKNDWSYTSTPPYTFMVWCPVKAQGQLYLDLTFTSHFSAQSVFLCTLFANTSICIFTILTPTD